jgi:hypothetical protein
VWEAMSTKRQQALCQTRPRVLDMPLYRYVFFCSIPVMDVQIFLFAFLPSCGLPEQDVARDSALWVNCGVMRIHIQTQTNSNQRGNRLLPPTLSHLPLPLTCFPRLWWSHVLFGLRQFLPPSMSNFTRRYVVAGDRCLSRE